MGMEWGLGYDVQWKLMIVLNTFWVSYILREKWLQEKVWVPNFWMYHERQWRE